MTLMKMKVAAEPFDLDGNSDMLNEEKWPSQGEWRGQEIIVVYGRGHGKKTTIQGTVLRHDLDEPHLLLVALTNGKYIMNMPFADLHPCN